MVPSVFHHCLGGLFVCLKPVESGKVEKAAQKVFQDSAFFLNLPPEIQEMVFDRLDLEGLCDALPVCRRFYELVGNRPLKFIFPPAIVNAVKHGRFLRMPRIRPPKFDLKMSKRGILKQIMKGKDLAWGRDDVGRYFLAVRYRSRTLGGERLEGIVALYQMMANRCGSNKIEWSVRDTLSLSYDTTDDYVVTRYGAGDIIGRFSFFADVPVLESFLQGKVCGVAQTNLISRVKWISDPSGENTPRIQMGGLSYETFFQYLKSFFN
jgi:hypothetical protein